LIQMYLQHTARCQSKPGTRRTTSRSCLPVSATCANDSRGMSDLTSMEQMRAFRVVEGIPGTRSLHRAIRFGGEGARREQAREWSYTRASFGMTMTDDLLRRLAFPPETTLSEARIASVDGGNSRSSDSAPSREAQTNWAEE